MATIPEYPENLAVARDTMVAALINGPGADGLYRYMLDGELRSMRHDALAQAIKTLDDQIHSIDLRQPGQRRLNIRYRGC